MSLGWFLSSRFGSRGSPVVPGHANHWFLTARRQFSAPDHGQNAASAAHPHLVTPPHLPGLSNIRHRYRSPSAELTSRTAEETGICRCNIHGQNNRNPPELRRRRGQFCALSRHVPLVPSHITLRLRLVLALGFSRSVPSSAVQVRLL